MDAEEYIPSNLVKGFFTEARNSLDSMDVVCPAYAELSGQESEYSYEHLIGAGATKEIYRCYDQKIRREVALAKPRSELGIHSYDAFIHEAWLVSTLQHPNIIKIHELSIGDDGVPFFTMDLLSNRTLLDFIGEGELSSLLKNFITICDAVAFAHSKNILHLDLKPENIQCDEYNGIIVCDWGLGKRYVGPGAEELSHLELSQGHTLYGQVKGSLGYMAPEQILPGAEKDFRTDVFALGSILYTILTKEAAFTGSKHDIIQSTQNGLLLAPHIKYPTMGIPRSLSLVVTKALSANPAERYQTVNELKSDVQRYLDGFPTRAEQPNSLRLLTLFLARHKVTVRLILVGLFILLGSTTTYWLKYAGVTKEKQLVEEDLDALYHEYEQFESVMADNKVELVRKITAASREKFLLHKTQNPVAALEDTEVLLRKALKLYPESVFAKELMALVYAIRMDFSIAKSYSHDLPGPRYKYIVDLAEFAEEFAYPLSSEVNNVEMAKFIRAAKLINSRDAWLIESMLRYNHYVRGLESPSSEVVAAFIDFINSGGNNTVTSFDSERGVLVVDSNQSLLLEFSNGVSVSTNVDVQCLQLCLQNQFDLSKLGGSKIRTLDLSRCGKVFASKEFYIEGLQEVIVKEGYIMPASLVEKINDGSDFVLSY